MPSLRPAIFKAVKCIDQMAAHFPRIGCFQPLKGTFSAYEELKQGRLQGKVLFESQLRGPIPDCSITRLSGLSQHDFQPWPVFWAVSDNARLVGKIRIWRNPEDRFCIEGNYYLAERRRLCEDRPTAQILPGRPVSLSGAWTSIASNWGDGRNYYHWITDNLTRLWMLEHLPEPVRVILPTSSARYMSESLELLDIAHECDTRHEPSLKPDRYYFCSPLAMTGVWNPLGFDWLRKSFKPYFRLPKSGSAIFLTRRGSNRIPDQLALIENLFEESGFQIVDCGSLTMRQQIEVASSAPAIAGIHGAAMTNIIWAAPSTPVLELFQPAYLNGCYEQIAFQGELIYSGVILSPINPLKNIISWLSGLEHIV